MRRSAVTVLTVAVLAFPAAAGAATPAAAGSFPAAGTLLFTTAGCQTWTVPPYSGITQVGIDAVGASGHTAGLASGGTGDGVQASASVAAGETLDVCVAVGGGSAGLGGLYGDGSDGGGASGVSKGSDFTHPLVIAAGGGGAGGAFGGSDADGGNAGATATAGGNGLDGPGGPSADGGGGGGGATDAGPGSGGSQGGGGSVGDHGGSFAAKGPGSGGEGGSNQSGNDSGGGGGGGGGGGYFGGGGGGGAQDSNNGGHSGGGAGGGGSDYCAGTCTVASGAGTGTEAGNATGDAQVALSWTAQQAAPTFTSADAATFRVNSAGSFTVTTDPSAYPLPTVTTSDGTLPSGVTLADNGDGTATVSGTPAAGTAGSYPITIHATNPAQDTTQAFTLTVAPPPNPSINATPFAPTPISQFGWYRSAVTVVFTCTTASAPLTAACPAPVQQTRSTRSFVVARTIHDTAGGSATVSAGPFKIDVTPPVVLVQVRKGKLKVTASDALSGVAHRAVKRHGRHYIVTVTDKAGNVTTVTGTLPKPKKHK